MKTHMVYRLRRSSERCEYILICQGFDGVFSHFLFFYLLSFEVANFVVSTTDFIVRKEGENVLLSSFSFHYPVFQLLVR